MTARRRAVDGSVAPDALDVPHGRRALTNSRTHTRADALLIKALAFTRNEGLGATKGEKSLEPLSLTTPDLHMDLH